MSVRPCHHPRCRLHPQPRPAVFPSLASYVFPLSVSAHVYPLPLSPHVSSPRLVPHLPSPSDRAPYPLSPSAFVLPPTPPSSVDSDGGSSPPYVGSARVSPGRSLLQRPPKVLVTAGRPPIRHVSASLLSNTPVSTDRPGPTCPIIHWLVHSFIHSFIHSLFVYEVIYLFLLIYLFFIHSFNHSFLHSFMYLFMYSISSTNQLFCHVVCQSPTFDRLIHWKYLR